MRKVVMLLALVLGTSLMANANDIGLKKTTSNETVASKHKKHRKNRSAKTVNAAPTATPKK